MALPLFEDPMDFSEPIVQIQVVENSRAEDDIDSVVREASCSASIAENRQFLVSQSGHRRAIDGHLLRDIDAVEQLHFIDEVVPGKGDPPSAQPYSRTFTLAVQLTRRFCSRAQASTAAPYQRLSGVRMSSSSPKRRSWNWRSLSLRVSRASAGLSRTSAQSSERRICEVSRGRHNNRAAAIKPPLNT